jgi:hypothetical protein
LSGVAGKVPETAWMKIASEIVQKQIGNETLNRAN